MSDYVLSEVDLKRCLEALQGEFYRMPIGLTREQRRVYMGDLYNAGLSDKVSLTREELKEHGERVLKAYADSDPQTPLDKFINL